MVATIGSLIGPVVEIAEDFVYNLTGAAAGGVRDQIGRRVGAGQPFLLRIPDILAPAGVKPPQSDRFEIYLECDQNVRIISLPQIADAAMLLRGYVGVVAMHFQRPDER